MVHRRPVYIYLLNVPSFSSRYFNKIKRTSRLGRLLALSLEILLQPLPPLVASPVLLQGSACLIITLIRSLYIKHPFQKDASDILCVGKFWEASEKKADTLSKCQRSFQLKILAGYFYTLK